MSLFESDCYFVLFVYFCVCDTCLCMFIQAYKQNCNFPAGINVVFLSYLSTSALAIRPIAALIVKAALRISLISISRKDRLIDSINYIRASYL